MAATTIFNQLHSFMLQRSSAPKVLVIITWLVGVVALGALGVLIAYTVQNDAGHTGFSVWSLANGFAPIFLFGFYALLRYKINAASVFCMTMGLFGLLTLGYLDRTATLLEYNHWIDRGMPAKGSASLF